MNFRFCPPHLRFSIGLSTWRDCLLSLSGNVLLSADSEGYLQTHTCDTCHEPRVSEKWRLVSPRTRDDWVLVASVDNCNGTSPLPVGHVIRGHVDTRHGEDVIIEAEMTRAALAASGGKNTELWSRVSVQELARDPRVRVGGCGHRVRPCHVWRLYQLVGQAGYTRIASTFVRNVQERCL